eukprot:EG_transcript_1789
MDLEGSLHVSVIRAGNVGSIFKGFVQLAFKGSRQNTSVKEGQNDIQWNETLTFPTKFKFTAAAALHLDAALQVALCRDGAGPGVSKDQMLPDLNPGKKQGVEVLLPSGALIFLEVRLLMGDISSGVSSRSRRTAGGARLLTPESFHARMSPSLPIQPVPSSESFHRAVNSRLSPTPPAVLESPRQVSPRLVTPTFTPNTGTPRTIGNFEASSSSSLPSTLDLETAAKKAPHSSLGTTIPAPAASLTPRKDEAAATPRVPSPSLSDSSFRSDAATRAASSVTATLTRVASPDSLRSDSATIASTRASDSVFGWQPQSDGTVSAEQKVPTTPEPARPWPKLPALPPLAPPGTERSVSRTLQYREEVATFSSQPEGSIRSNDSPSSLSVLPSEHLSPRTQLKDTDGAESLPDALPPSASAASLLSPTEPLSQTLPADATAASEPKEAPYTPNTPNQVRAASPFNSISTPPQMPGVPPTALLTPTVTSTTVRSPGTSPVMLTKVSNSVPSIPDLAQREELARGLLVPSVKVSEVVTPLAPTSPNAKTSDYEVTQVVEIHQFATPLSQVESSREEYQRRTTTRSTSSVITNQTTTRALDVDGSFMSERPRLEPHAVPGSPSVSIASSEANPKVRHTISTLMSLLSTMTQQQVWDLCFYILRQETEVSSKEAYMWASQFIQSFGDVCADQQQFDLWMSLITVVLSRMRLALRQAQSKLVAMEGEASKFALLHDQFRKDADHMREQVTTLERQLQQASDSLDSDIRLERLRADALEHELNVLRQRPTTDMLENLRSQLLAERGRVEHLEARLRALQEQHDHHMEALRGELARERARAEHLVGQLSSMEVGREESYAALQAAHARERTRADRFEAQLRGLEPLRTELLGERQRSEHLERELATARGRDAEAVEAAQREWARERRLAEQALDLERHTVEQLKSHVRDLETRLLQSPLKDREVQALRQSLEEESRQNVSLRTHLEHTSSTMREIEEKYIVRIRELERQLQMTPATLPGDRLRSCSRADGAYVA